MIIKLITYVFFGILTYAQEPITIDIGEQSIRKNSAVQLELIHRIQNYKNASTEKDFRDIYLQSPKSAQFIPDGKKLYVQSLEGFTTTVYSVPGFERLKVINHKFDRENSYLFKDSSIFDYTFHSKTAEINTFSGKPVEAVFTHSGKYLWVTYYRRSFDLNAIDPSALAIIDTESDSIVRVMPTGPLPKMIAVSQNDRYVAVTHWGDNTIGLIDISGSLNDFHYVKHLVVGRQLSLAYSDTSKVDRDHDCGYCLRGTVFLPDNKTLIVGRMGGGGISAFDINEMRYLGTQFGMSNNVRHLISDEKNIFLSANINGTVQMLPIESFKESIIAANGKSARSSDWKTVYVGTGARTISMTGDGNYIFSAINNLSKVVVIDRKTFKVINEIKADSYPVGMDISPDNKLLVVTAQGRNREGGNSVMIYKITKDN